MTEGSSARRGVRVVVRILWWILPVVVLLAVGAYFVGIGIDHADPPIIAVQGHSMQPTLVTGDLVVIEGVNPSTLKVGDVIAVTVPTAARQKYDLPPHVVHRIVKITHTPSGPVFTTKGDNNPSPDVFKTTAVDVIGEVHYTVPDLGFVVLFFGSKEGHIFLGAVGAVVVVYLAIGAWEKRQRSVQGLVETIESLSIEGAGDPETKATLRELVSAVGEYGEHLKAHTAVMRALADTTEGLKAVVVQLSTVTRPAEQIAPELGTEGAPPQRPMMLAIDEWSAVGYQGISPDPPPVWEVEPLPRR